MHWPLFRLGLVFTFLIAPNVGWIRFVQDRTSHCLYLLARRQNLGIFRIARALIRSSEKGADFS